MSADEIRRRELADFLRIRRARITPADVGLPAGPRRRTPGLRREEIAEIAGVGLTWYTWLEQGRNIRVSARVIERLARVLRLDAAEQVQFSQLAIPDRAPEAEPRQERSNPQIQRMLDNMAGSPALLMGRRWDLLAWNVAARAVFLDYGRIPPAERNLLWLFFVNPAMRRMVADWEPRARDVLARFRADYGRFAGDPRFVALIDRLKRASPEFADWWPRHDILPRVRGRKLYDHPIAGRLLLDHATLSFTDDPHLKLVVYTPATELDSIAKVDRLIASFREPRTRKSA